MPAWLRAIRPQFLTATAVPVVLGSVAAWRDTGGFLWSRFWLAAAGALLIHIGSNLANEYGDHLIQEGLVAPRSILLASVMSLALGACLGLYLNALVRGNVILLLGLAGIFLGYFYSRAPLKLGYRGLGEVAVGVGFGPLMVTGSYYVQVEKLPVHVLLLSLPIGLLIAAVLLINGFPDRETDLAVGKRCCSSACTR
jgi:1,4-dihydroxy-2-naphthoate octaprenyltransferase